jgi:hypothetical protein
MISLRGGKCASSSNRICGKVSGRPTWKLKKLDVSRACVLAAFMIKANKLPGKSAIKKLFKWALVLSKDVKKFNTFDIFLQNSQELAAATNVKKIIDVTPLFTKAKACENPRTGTNGSTYHSLCTHQQAHEELKSMGVNTVVVMVKATGLEVIILRSSHHEKITLKPDGSCRASSRSNKHFLENIETEVIIFENI